MACVQSLELNTLELTKSAIFAISIIAFTSLLHSIIVSRLFLPGWEKLGNYKTSSVHLSVFLSVSRTSPLQKNRRGSGQLSVVDTNQWNAMAS